MGHKRITQERMIIIEGIVGRFRQPVIAIDDIFIYEEPCPHPVECDFESDFCEWTPNGWILQNGKGNKPSLDHSTRTSVGHYVYLDSYFGRPGNTAILESENLFDTPACIKFWYHMTGRGVGSLQVQYVDPTNRKIVTLSGMFRNQGNQWKEYCYYLHINSTKSLQTKIPPCGANFYFCKDKTYPPCIHRDKLCNNVTDCSDGSDESLCDKCIDTFCKNDGTCSMDRRLPVCKCKAGYAQNRCGGTVIIPELEKDVQRYHGSSTAWIPGVVIGTILLAAIIFTVWYKRNTNVERERLPHALDNPMYGVNLENVS